MEDLAGPHAVGMRIPRVFHAGRSFIFWYSSSSPKAEKMRAADGSAQLMEAHLQLISAEESGKLASHAFAAAAGAAAAGAAQRARAQRGSSSSSARASDGELRSRTLGPRIRFSQASRARACARQQRARHAPGETR